MKVVSLPLRKERTMKYRGWVIAIRMGAGWMYKRTTAGEAVRWFVGYTENGNKAYIGAWCDYAVRKHYYESVLY